MKLVIPGGTGQLGSLLAGAFRARGSEVVVLGRGGGPGVVQWDGRTVGPWAAELEGADAVLNLAGRSVNCRYTPANREAILRSRVDSTRAVGLAIQAAARPPRAWLQMSTATLYAHRLDAPNDEATGRIGAGAGAGTPGAWRFSVEVAQAWERAQREAATPRTRQLVLRTAMVMSPDRGGIFDVLLALTRFGLGGPVAGGRQFVSWIEGQDLVRALEFLLAREDLEGPVNLAAPGPLPQRDFMAALRRAWGARVGLPATRWMAEVGALLLGTETELVLKSRRVVPGRLLEAGFTFQAPEWPPAAQALVRRWREARAAGA